MQKQDIYCNRCSGNTVATQFAAQINISSQEERKNAIADYQRKWETAFTNEPESFEKFFTPDCKIQAGGNYTLHCEGGGI